MFRVTILNNKRMLYEGTAECAVLPGYEEEISILPFHRPMLGRLRRGVITVYGPGSEGSKADKTEGIDRISIAGGVARMIKNELVVLVE